MEKIYFNELLLKTAFSCMACDGQIDKRELELIKKLHNENTFFGELDIDDFLNIWYSELSQDGQKFLRNFFKDLSSTILTIEDELKIIEAAIKTIKADEKIEYSEIKFFKVIRSKLKIQNDSILAVHPDFEEYLEQDIMSDSYLAQLQDDFFNFQKFDKTELINNLDLTSFKDFFQNN